MADGFASVLVHQGSGCPVLRTREMVGVSGSLAVQSLLAGAAPEHDKCIGRTVAVVQSGQCGFGADGFASVLAHPRKGLACS